jgi:hypothetical protein
LNRPTLEDRKANGYDLVAEIMAIIEIPLVSHKMEIGL